MSNANYIFFIQPQFWKFEISKTQNWSWMEVISKKN